MLVSQALEKNAGLLEGEVIVRRLRKQEVAAIAGYIHIPISSSEAFSALFMSFLAIMYFEVIS